MTKKPTDTPSPRDARGLPTPMSERPGFIPWTIENARNGKLFPGLNNETYTDLLRMEVRRRERLGVTFDGTVWRNADGSEWHDEYEDHPDGRAGGAKKPFASQTYRE